EALGDLGVEAILVDRVVAVDPAPPEGEQLGEPPLPLLVEELLGRRLEGGEPVTDRDARQRVSLLGGRRCPGPPCGVPALLRGAGRSVGTGRGTSAAPRGGEVAGGGRRPGPAAAATRPALGPDRDDLCVRHERL